MLCYISTQSRATCNVILPHLHRVCKQQSTRGVFRSLKRGIIGVFRDYRAAKLLANKQIYSLVYRSHRLPPDGAHTMEFSSRELMYLYAGNREPGNVAYTGIRRGSLCRLADKGFSNAIYSGTKYWSSWFHSGVVLHCLSHRRNDARRNHKRILITPKMNDKNTCKLIRLAFL
jgi:hypothetical protein